MLEVLPVRESGKPKDSHGKIGFAAMARTVAKMWKEIDPTAKAEYERISEIDKNRYAREIEEWRKKKAALEAKQKVAKKEEKKRDAQKEKGAYQTRTPAAEELDESRLRRALSAAAQRAYPGPLTVAQTATHLFSSQHLLPEELAQPASLHSQLDLSQYYERCQQLGLFDLLERNLGPAGIDFVRETFSDSWRGFQDSETNHFQQQQWPPS